MKNFIEISQYMPHGMCLLWQPWLVVLWAGSDLLIFLAYMAIPFALLTVMKRRGDVPFGGLVMLFASFILLCGLTHLMGIVTLWYPIYPWVGLLKLATGIVSMVTAVVLFRLIPTLVALPSPAHLREANEALRQEVMAHEETLASLEATVEERTIELRELNKRLAVQAREAVHRSRNLLSVVSSLASQSARGATSMEDFLETLHGRIGSLADATALVVDQDLKSNGNLQCLVEKQLEPLLNAYQGQVSVSGPPLTVTPEAAQQLSLALHELATNAQKYGFEKSGATQVHISWRTVSETDEVPRFELNWVEEAPSGFNEDFATGERIGFGSKLVNHIVPSMLRGQATRTFDEKTFSYRLSAPLDAVVVQSGQETNLGLAARLVDQSFGVD